jgi:RNA polymerase sigma factor (sigma-70 family)
VIKAYYSIDYNINSIRLSQWSMQIIKSQVNKTKAKTKFQLNYFDPTFSCFSASMVFKEENIHLKDVKDLIAGCLARDRSSQKKIYEMFGPAMMGLCLRYCQNREEAEEVLQDGFIQMFKNIAHFQFRGSFEGWLRRIMINCALQRYRGKLNYIKLVTLTDQDSYLSDETDLIDRLSEKELIERIQTLPPACRLVFNLYVFDGLKHSEIAQLLHISEGTSKSNLSDARQILKRQLKPELKIIR